MPQFSPMSWCLIALFLFVMMLSVSISLWWGGGVATYSVSSGMSKGGMGCFRLFGWKSA
uniref:ATP synthase F0 subunit 8 n=1 Tax=Sinohyriopsis cumingii TaxID=165450 RepID=A0A0C4G3P0_SINCU|nr:ATP synthase F0 subunit 8 [Sinohyriopsis cumingii]